MKPKKTVSKEAIHTIRFIFAPFAILILGKILFELLAFKLPELNQNLIEHLSQNTSSVSYLETKARLQWLTSVILYFFITAVFITFIIHIFRRSLTKSNLWLFFSIAFFYSVAEITYLSLIDRAKSPIVSIFRFTFDSLNSSGLFTAFELNLIDNTMSLINLLAIAIVPFGIMAGCYIMHNQKTSSNPDLNDLLCQSKLIKDILVGGSSIMVIGIAHMQLWLNWPLSFLANDPMRHQIEAITLAVSQYWGVVYTLTMAALYLPIAFYLTAKAKSLILAGSDEQAKKNPDQWLAENKMLISPFAQLPQLIAMIAPMLIGSFGTILGKLMPF